MRGRRRGGRRTRGLGPRRRRPRRPGGPAGGRRTPGLDHRHHPASAASTSSSSPASTCPAGSPRRWPERAAELLPDGGTAVDLCTGSGAIALVLSGATPGGPGGGHRRRPGGRGLRPAQRRRRPRGATSTTRCPTTWPVGSTCCCAVLPYVPTGALHLLPRDVLAYEPRRALDGGADGLGLVAEVVARSPRWVRPGGWLLLEVGGDQVGAVAERYVGRPATARSRCSSTATATPGRRRTARRPRRRPLGLGTPRPLRGSRAAAGPTRAGAAWPGSWPRSGGSAPG